MNEPGFKPFNELINIYYNYTMHLYFYFCMPIKCGQNYEKLVVPYKI
jgi:hypothetical protein